MSFKQVFYYFLFEVFVKTICWSKKIVKISKTVIRNSFSNLVKYLHVGLNFICFKIMFLKKLFSLFFRLTTTKLSNKLHKKNYRKMSSEESTEIDIDIKVNNIQCTFNVRCLLNIEDIIERGVNVELRKSRDRVTMQLRF